MAGCARLSPAEPLRGPRGAIALARSLSLSCSVVTEVSGGVGGWGGCEGRAAFAPCCPCIICG